MFQYGLQHVGKRTRDLFILKEGVERSLITALPDPLIQGNARDQRQLKLPRELLTASPTKQEVFLVGMVFFMLGIFFFSNGLFLALHLSLISSFF